MKEMEKGTEEKMEGLVIDVATESYEAKWYPYKGADFKIRPYPVGNSDVTFGGDENQVIWTGKSRKKLFIYCLVGWKNLVDKNGKEIVYSDKMKNLIFDYDLADIPLFVQNTHIEVYKKIKVSEKN